MAVAESHRGQGKFEVLIKTQELAMYTVRICSNPKTFDPKYWDTIIKIYGRRHNHGYIFNA